MHPSPPDFLNELMRAPIPLTDLDLGRMGLPLHKEKSHAIRVSIARLDLVHPTISGNKLFKLWYFLEQFYTGAYNKIVTFGGAWSNHLHATAYAASRLGIPSAGIVRGEAPAHIGPTLQDCKSWGMELHFISRAAYREPGNVLAGIFGDPAPPGLLVIPEGGSGAAGIAGASLVLEKVPCLARFTHIICAVGTGTTLQGIDRSLLAHQQALGIPVLAIPPGDRENFQQSLGLGGQTRIHFDYSFGGYAKRKPELTAFMKLFSETQGVPLDFVYTGKAAYGMVDLIQKSAFPPGSQVLFLHTGGLQGNRSVPGC